jgi:large subunit ribosomal protein L30
MLRIKLVRSPIAAHWRTRATIQALGLRKVSQVIEKEDTPSIRGMAIRVKEFLIIEDLANETVVYDARTFRKHATRKDRKPSETTHQ